MNSWLALMIDRMCRIRIARYENKMKNLIQSARRKRRDGGIGSLVQMHVDASDGASAILPVRGA